MHSEDSRLMNAIDACRKRFVAIGVFSLFINLLMLTARWTCCNYSVVSWLVGTRTHWLSCADCLCRAPRYDDLRNRTWRDDGALRYMAGVVSGRGCSKCGRICEFKGQRSAVGSRVLLISTKNGQLTRTSSDRPAPMSMQGNVFSWPLPDRSDNIAKFWDVYNFTYFL